MNSSLNIAWLAGLLEGEGTFHISKRKNALLIRVMMTDKDVVARAAVMFGSRITGPLKTKTPKGNAGKLVFQTSVNGRWAAAWMMTLYKFLGERRRAKVRLALDVWKQSPVDKIRSRKVPNGQRALATCHPGKEAKGMGLCGTCYKRAWCKSRKLKIHGTTLFD